MRLSASERTIALPFTTSQARPMDLLRVKHPHAEFWHYAVSSEIRPVCGCGCSSSGLRKKQGDVLCRCVCHGFGLKFSLSLCEKFNHPNVRSAILFPRTVRISRPSWSIVKGRGRGCAQCNVLGIEATREDMKERIRRIHS